MFRKKMTIELGMQKTHTPPSLTQVQAKSQFLILQWTVLLALAEKLAFRNICVISCK